MSVTIRELLNKKGNDVYSVSTAATVYEAIELMSKYQVGALLVMEDSRLVGIISERDYTRKVILKDLLSKTTTVEEIMTKDVVFVTPDNDIDECMMKMNQSHIRHLPVLHNDEVVGVITIMDVIQNILIEKQFIIEQMEQYISGNG